MNMYAKAPFTYFGSKLNISSVVWGFLGEDVPVYIEPFFGAGAVFFTRNNFSKGHTEIINDKDGFVVNVWRALQNEPIKVAKHCDYPATQIDLLARRQFLLENKSRMEEGLLNDPEWFDTKLAGYWIWSMCNFIGFDYSFLHVSKNGKLVNKRIKFDNIGINHSKNKKEKEIDGKISYNAKIYDWFSFLSKRLRFTKIFYGEWKRACTFDWEKAKKTVGFFLDPPYGDRDRKENLYRIDSFDIYQDVLEWCLEKGEKRNYRIVLAGYAEYKQLLDAGWLIYKYKGSQHTKKEKEQNRFKETLYISPHCLKLTKKFFLL